MDNSAIHAICYAAIGIAAIVAAYRSEGDKAVGFWLIAVCAAVGVA